MAEVMRIMATSSRRSQACTAAFRAPDPAAGHRQPTPLLETPGHSWANLGQSLVQTLLLSPGSWCMQGFVYTLQGSVSPVLCKFWWLYGGVNGNLLQEGYAIPRSAAPRAPAPEAGHCGPYLCRRHSNTVLAQSLWGLWVLVHMRFVGGF